MGVGVEGDGGYVRFHAPHLDSGLRRKERRRGGAGDDGGYVRFHAPRLGSGLRRKDGLEGCGGWWVGWGLCMNGLDSSASPAMIF